MFEWMVFLVQTEESAAARPVVPLRQFSGGSGLVGRELRTVEPGPAHGACVRNGRTRSLHTSREIAEAIAEQTVRLTYYPITRQVSNRPAAELAAKLATVAPGRRTFPCSLWS